MRASFVLPSVIVGVLALSGCARPAPSGGVEGNRIEAFSGELARFRARAEGRPFAEQLRAWDDEVEHPHQAFYDDVVWERRRGGPRTEKETALLHERFAAYASSFDGIDGAFRAFSDRAAAQIVRFRALVPDLPQDIPIIAAPGPTFDAKSALLGGEGGQVVLAFAVDSLVLERANLDIVFPHELFHAYHARTRGFLNDGVMTGATLAVPLWEEGLATYVSGLLNPSASDGELLLDPALGKVPRKDVGWLARKFREQAAERVLVVERTDVFKRWFSVSPARVRDDLPNRCGYLLGLHVARTLAQNHALGEMIAWSPQVAREKVIEAVGQIGESAGGDG